MRITIRCDKPDRDKSKREQILKHMLFGVEVFSVLVYGIFDYFGHAHQFDGSRLTKLLYAIAASPAVHNCDERQTQLPY